MKKVELIEAYQWTCDECGRDTFGRLVATEPEAVDLDELPDDVKEWVEMGGEFNRYIVPKVVRCSHCGAEFETLWKPEAGEEED